MRGDPGFELDDLGLQPGELDQGRRRFGGAHRPHGCVDHTVRNPRMCAVAVATWWWGAVIVVMGLLKH